MICDRTRYDVVKANSIWKNKVQKFKTLSRADLLTLERGRVTIDTLNRIESKQQDIVDKIPEIGYYVDGVATKEWGGTDIFGLADFERILENLEKIRKAYFVASETPSVPAPELHYTVFNDIEKMLVDIEGIYDYMTSHYLECGAAECGDTI